MTRLVVGLGNPGPEYADTRHNVGFKVVDLLGENLRASYWKDQAGSQVAVVRFGDEDLVLAKPQAFMNVSGGPVAKLCRRVRCRASRTSSSCTTTSTSRRAACLQAGRRPRRAQRTALACTRSSATMPTCGCASAWGALPGAWIRPTGCCSGFSGDALEELEASVPTAAQAVLHILEHGIDDAMREYNAD